MNHINVDHPSLSFGKHIINENNKQILFSAAFGSGKTYFLNKYFEDNKREFNTFWLSPVNYVISQNEDIFEYIKYDIASQLIQHSPIRDQIEIKYKEAAYWHQYITNNPKDALKVLFGTLEGMSNLVIPSLGIPISITGEAVGKAGNSILDFFNNYEKTKIEINKHLETPNQKLLSYLIASSNIKGSIYEDNLISQVISVGLQAIKQSKHNVLIIDDLDRLDPEHIFRILNILAVHQDTINKHNKFGFDKIIIVCHIENIRHIYEHKYGPKVDFNGYIEKYYSSDIFRFTNERAIQSFCDSGLSVELSTPLQFVLSICLNHFVRSGEIKVRNIIKHGYNPLLNSFILVSGKIKIKEDTSSIIYQSMQAVKGTYDSKEFFINSDDFDFFKVLRILTTIFGDYERLKKAVKEVQDSTDHIRNYNAEVFDNIIRIFGPLKILEENYNNESDKLAINYRSGNSYSSNTGKSIETVTLPYTRILDRRFTINLGWTISEPYPGNVSLYQNKQDIYEKSIVEYIDTNSSPSNPPIANINSKQIIEMISNFLKFLDVNGITTELGLI